ncbi:MULTISPECIES: hypothetical protein [Pseudoalteromonas]|uniref:hypothetical protein n=1 Tax=Pseudoalteromonas TaxID=53246 RepID=UPI000C7E41DC|nr:hypothetical protein [Pseudoalteromonas sp. NC201]AUJ72377.1 hypothetical protein PNC201_20805 [Pseudoalteromonas sp. NC201]
MIKPTILLVLLVTIIGYVFCIRCHLTNPKFCKSDGYHTFLNSAVWGAIFMISATIILYFLDCFQNQGGLLTHGIMSIVREAFPQVYFPLYGVNLAQIALVALVLSFFIPSLLMFCATRLTGESRQYVRALAFRKIAHTDDSPEFTSIFYQSWDFGLPIAFTLSNGKVYIGYAFTGGTHLNDIMVLPFRSGYRSKEENRLEIVTNYEPVWDELEHEFTELENEFTEEFDELEGELEGELEDKLDNDYEPVNLNKFLISIPVREIIHANLHDFDYKDKFSKYEVSRKEDKDEKMNAVIAAMKKMLKLN